ncbi:hypothetical protein BD626DRAFT_474666 [Schizophyllum amplum]|uniref:Secreted protein n=1 Tax=Schizophyllum amplum TaxID=97359 RepID=A0A550CXU1_9AGAR|nr:hypothetical protein BD626DRAFT_474666 [Auriculariopsis ampla]
MCLGLATWLRFPYYCFLAAVFSTCEPLRQTTSGSVKTSHTRQTSHRFCLLEADTSPLAHQFILVMFGYLPCHERNRPSLWNRCKRASARRSDARPALASGL